MKTIKIFLASSEELDYDRMAFGNLVRRLDDMYEKRGIRIKLFEWEDYDSAYNDKRKQDEYNEYVCQSDIFLALFHKKAGQFTIEEFDKASEQFKATASPKVYTYCKDLKPGEEESPELKEFKERLFNEMGHYWCRYDNRESLHLQFVMQLQLVESSQMTDLKVEDGNVTLNGLPIAPMDKLKFAACNEEYLKKSEELASLPPKIEKARLRLDKFPDDEDLQDDLQTKLDRYNQLKKDFEEYQQILFNTAKRIAQLQSERITERMRRAMDAFNEGRVHEANIILDEAKEDARRDFDEFKQSVEITEIKRQNVINHINEKLFNASSILADAVIPIENRILRAEELYEEAYNMAKYEHVDYGQQKYIDLIDKYSSFLYKYAKYDEALTYEKELLGIRIKVLGKNHPKIASSYNNIGNVYYHKGDYDRALEYYKKALKIREKVLGKDNPDTASSYNNIGNVYSYKGDNDRALEYYKKPLEIWEEVLGKDHPKTALSNNNIGNVYFYKGDYDRALEYHMKALEIWEEVLGKDHPDTAMCYNNIGNVYSYKGDYDHALEYHMKALEIKEKILGKDHPDTAISYNNIGLVYSDKGDYDRALEYHMKALEIKEKILGKDHPSIASTYGNIAKAYFNLNDFLLSLSYAKKAQILFEKVLGAEHPNTAHSYNGLSQNLYKIGKYEEALLWAEKAINILPEDIDNIDNLACIYQELKRYEEALVQFQLCLEQKKKKNMSNNSIKETEEKICNITKLMKK